MLSENPRKGATPQPQGGVNLPAPQPLPGSDEIRTQLEEVATPKDKWETLAVSLFKKAERIVETPEKSKKTAYFWISETVRGFVSLYENTLEKLEIEIFGEDEIKTIIRIFFGLEDGRTESIRVLRDITKVFDNGIRRGPDRRSIHTTCAFRQDFSASGEASELKMDCPGAIARLLIHTQNYIERNSNSEQVANSFLGYSFDDSGIIPAGNRTADMSRSSKNERIHITEMRRINSAYEDIVSQVTEVSVTEPLAGKLPYQIELFAEHIEVKIAGQHVTNLHMYRQFQYSDLEKMISSKSKTQEINE